MILYHFCIYKYHINLYWRSSLKELSAVRVEIENHYKTKVDFIQWIKD